MSELQERFQRWADELVDLTARNELINFKVTKTSTILPDPKGLSKLLNGDTVAITDLCDLTDPDQMKPAKGAIKTAIEFKEQRGIEVLKLASGFATWNQSRAMSETSSSFQPAMAPERSESCATTLDRLTETRTCLAYDASMSLSHGPVNA